MDPASEKIFEATGEDILKEAADRYDFDKTGLRRLGSFESLVFEFEKDGRGFILKVTHSLHRTPDLVRGELDWTGFLLKHGVDVSRTILSRRGEFLEIIDGRSIPGLAEDYFIIYVLEKAPGRRTTRHDWNDLFVRDWGRLVGRMNILAKSYRPANSQWKRFEWHRDKSLEFEKHIPSSQAIVRRKGRELINRLRAWNTDLEHYGLIHSDMHHGNFLSDEGRITIFDFDDCHYGWFGFDIAMPLFYVMRDQDVDENDMDFAGRFLGDFLEGYRTENQLDPIWIERIPDFMKLRELDLYSVVYAENAADLNGWCKRFMADRRYRIENDVPVIDIDFSQFR